MEVDHGCVLPVVHTFYLVLAAGVDGAGVISICVAHHLAVSHRGHRGPRSFRAAFGDSFPAGSLAARSERDLSTENEKCW